MADSDNSPQNSGEPLSTAISREIPPTVLPIIGKNLFSTIRQGTATNALTKVPATKRNTSVDKIKGTATITQGNVSITMPSLTKAKGLKTSTYQLLDALIVAFSESGTQGPLVELSLEDYMKMRGLKDRKEARKQVIENLDTLFSAKITVNSKSHAGKYPDFIDVHLIRKKGIVRGIIKVLFEDEFYNILKGYPIMPYPNELFQLNGHRYPNSYFFLRKITEHKNMNVGKKNEDIISVETLLSVAPYLPSYAEVAKKDRAYTRYIIEPFERDMDALEATLNWEYCHSNNMPLTDEELKTMSYDIFHRLLVKITWKQYPDQTARLERKAERLEKAKTARKKRCPKKPQKTDK